MNFIADNCGCEKVENGLAFASPSTLGEADALRRLREGAEVNGVAVAPEINGPPSRLCMEVPRACARLLLGWSARF
jgi:hypothetical protein